MPALWPCIDDIAFDPELASLAVLDAALAITVQALIARNPELLDHDPNYRPPPLVVAAYNIVVLQRELQQAMNEYRALLPPRTDLASGSDDFPF